MMSTLITCTTPPPLDGRINSTATSAETFDRYT
jgi:hypothetical protein